MEKKIRTLSYGYFALFVMLLVSGMLSGIFAEITYYLAFILPFAVICILERKEGLCPRLFTLDSEGARITALATFPCVCLVMVISYITSIAIYLAFGQTNSVDLGNSLPLALVNYALLPALLEEMLFRYLPMRMLAPYSKRAAVLVSAFFFALIHSSLFSIPYAFAAGVIFMTVDLMAGSVIPSALIHFVNNAASVLMIFYPNMPVTPVIFTLGGISLVLISFRWADIKEKIKNSFDKGEGLKLSAEMSVFAAITLLVAVLGLIGGNNG